nr:hypothetical protein [Tanacetum cinerariifolium]
SVPKPKASARRKRSGSDTSITPPIAITSPTTTDAVTPRLTAAAKGKQPAKSKSPSDPSELARIEAQQLKIVLRRSRQEMHISQYGSFGIDEGTGTKPGVPDVPSDDLEEEISWNSSDDEETDTQEQDIHDDEGDEKDESDHDEEDDDDDKDGDESDDDEEEIAKIDVHDDTERGGDDDKESENDEESDDEETREEESFDPIPRTPEDNEDDGNNEEDQGFKDGEDEWLNEEEVADELYRDMNEAVRVAVQIQTDWLRDSYERENDEFLRTIDENMKRIIKEQVKSQVKEQVSKILPRIEQSVNAQLEAEVLTSALTNKGTFIRPEAYEADKIILDTYGERVILKRRRDDDDDQGEGPSAGSNRRSKRQRERKEPESASAQLEHATTSVDRSTTGSKSRQASASESTFVEEPVQNTSQIEEPSHPVFEIGAEDQPIV